VAEDDGSALSWGTILSLAPDNVEALLRNPRKWLAEYLVGGIIGFTVFVADILAQPFGIVVDVFSSLGDDLGAPARIVLDVGGGVWGYAETVLLTVSSQFGPAAPLVTVGLILVILIVALRLALAVFVALEEIAGSIPVIGGAISGTTKALRALFGGTA
jgi:hypothetical protein